jgi:hypothetical protein
MKGMKMAHENLKKTLEEGFEKTKTITATVPESLYDQLDAVCQKARLRKSDFVRLAIQDALGEVCDTDVGYPDA